MELASRMGATPTPEHYDVRIRLNHSNEHAAFGAGSDVGAAAIESASAGRVRGLYACPLCMRGFRDPGELTREHVPAQVAGGRKLVLACRECNSAAGASLEKHLGPARTLHEFATGTLTAPIPAHLVVGDDRVTVSLTASGSNVPDRRSGEYERSGRGGTSSASSGVQWRSRTETQIRLDTGSTIPRKAQLATLKAGYLAAFAMFGYRYSRLSSLCVSNSHTRTKPSSKGSIWH